MLRERHTRTEAELRQQLEQQRAAHDLTLKHQRMSFYRDALADHSLGVVVLQLIEHPEDVKAVAGLLQSRKDGYLKNVWETLNKMIAAHQISMADLDPVRQGAMDHLREALDIMAKDARIGEAVREAVERDPEAGTGLTGAP
jgi:hypothetical protein